MVEHLNLKAGLSCWGSKARRCRWRPLPVRLKADCRPNFDRWSHSWRFQCSLSQERLTNLSPAWLSSSLALRQKLWIKTVADETAKGLFLYFSQNGLSSLGLVEKSRSFDKYLILEDLWAGSVQGQILSFWSRLPFIRLASPFQAGGKRVIWLAGSEICRYRCVSNCTSSLAGWLKPSSIKKETIFY